MSWLKSKFDGYVTTYTRGDYEVRHYRVGFFMKAEAFHGDRLLGEFAGERALEDAKARCERNPIPELDLPRAANER